MAPLSMFELDNFARRFAKPSRRFAKTSRAWSRLRLPLPKCVSLTPFVLSSCADATKILVRERKNEEKKKKKHFR